MGNVLCSFIGGTVVFPHGWEWRVSWVEIRGFIKLVLMSLCRSERSVTLSAEGSASSWVSKEMYIFMGNDQSMKISIIE